VGVLGLSGLTFSGIERGGFGVSDESDSPTACSSSSMNLGGVVGGGFL
jgi:hypothetical protein